METITNIHGAQALGSDTLKQLTIYYNEMQQELDAILSYWIQNTHDRVYGGFTGRIDEDNNICPDAPKGAVLNSRILWAFSSAYKISKVPEHLHLARIAFNHLNACFIDPIHGGVYWSVEANGRPLDTKKQIYALAFALYGCCAFYEASNNEAAKITAIEIYNQIEKHSYDNEHTGYLEAFTRDWQPLDDLRLSAKDANEKKTMNTHLHVLEAYTSLYRIWPGGKLKEQIKNLLNNFTGHIVNAATGHLDLFFDEMWNMRPGPVSYGHDIEAAWLLPEAAEAIDDLTWKKAIKNLSIKISTAAAAGLDDDGGLWYEYDPVDGHFIKEKHWWVQAEAMVGFLNAWQLTGDETDLKRSLQAWAYTRKNIKDHKHGEWFWGRNENGSVMKQQDKVGIWKCPYHNSRACIEIINRLRPYLVLHNPHMGGQ